MLTGSRCLFAVRSYAVKGRDQMTRGEDDIKLMLRCSEAAICSTHCDADILIAFAVLSAVCVINTHNLGVTVVNIRKFDLNGGHEILAMPVGDDDNVLLAWRVVCDI